MNGTIDYYNKNAKEYFESTSKVYLGMLYDKFLEHIPTGGRIMDIGCGSGRDVKWFRDHGYEAYGLDASEELVKIARAELGIPVEIGRTEEWKADEPFDGIWCCASLMHLNDEACRHFFENLNHNLKPGGALYVSVKSGIETGEDEAGRYLRNFTEEELREMINTIAGLKASELWFTEDTMHRSNFRW